MYSMFQLSEVAEETLLYSISGFTQGAQETGVYGTSSKIALYELIHDMFVIACERRRFRWRQLKNIFIMMAAQSWEVVSTRDAFKIEA